MSILHLLVDVALWMRNEPSGDHGRFSEHLVTIDPELPIRLQIAGASDKMIGSQERAEVTHVAFTEPEVEMLREDWLFINGRRYKVLDREAPSLPHHLRWKLQEQQQTSGVQS